MTGLRFENVTVAGQRIDTLAAPYAGAAGSTYRNPVLRADYSDPDVVRVGDDYYLTASSFQAVPGLPVLHSRDLVNWTARRPRGSAAALTRLRPRRSTATGSGRRRCVTTTAGSGSTWATPTAGIFLIARPRPARALGAAARWCRRARA